MTGQKFAFIALALLLYIAPLYADEATIITREQIITQLHLTDVALEVEIPKVISRRSQSKLIVMSRQVNGRTIQLRLRCAESACVPFYVKLRFHDGADANSALLDLQPPAYRRSPNKARCRIVKAGSSAFLEIVSAAVRVRLQVRCLQSGSQGDIIRVRDEQTRRVYSARVIDKDHVKAES